jgi:Gaa1-like, GPI transamidase component
MQLPVSVDSNTLHLQAVVLELHSSDVSALEVTGVGYSGQLPKLDLWMLAEHAFSRIAGSYVTLPGPHTLPDVLPVQLFKPLERQLAWLEGQLRGSQRYVQKLVQLSGFVGRQALGQPGGGHAPCKSYGVDAVTVRTTEHQVRSHAFQLYLHA